MRGPCICVGAMLAGCSAVLGIEDLHPPTIHGTVRDIATDNVSNVAVVLFRDPDAGTSDATRVDDVTTGDRGTFQIPITASLPLSGYFDLVDPRLVRTFSHLVQPVVDHADVDVEIVTLTPAELASLASDAVEPLGPQGWVVIAQVVDASGSTLTGATVTAETVAAQAGDPAVPVSHICYANPATGLPCGTGTATGVDGNAWLFDVPDMTSLTITATDAAGHPHATSFPIVAGPGLVFTPVPPAP